MEAARPARKGAGSVPPVRRAETPGEEDACAIWPLILFATAIVEEITVITSRGDRQHEGEGYTL